jgi:hypothetical protein
MQKWKPKSKWEERVAKTLHGSVLALFDKPSVSLQVANTAVRVARAMSGPAGALLTALYCYVIPVQVTGIATKEMVKIVIENEVGVKTGKEADSMNQEVRGGYGGNRGAGAALGTGVARISSERAYSSRLSFKGKKKKTGNRQRGGVRLDSSLVYSRMISAFSDASHGAHGSFDPVVAKDVERNHAKIVQQSGNFRDFSTTSNSELNSLFSAVLDKITGDASQGDDVAAVRDALVANSTVRALVSYGGEVVLGWRECVARLRKISSPVSKSIFLMDCVADGAIPDVWVAPLKQHPASKTKVNLRLGDVLKDIKKYFNDAWMDIAAVFQCTAGCANDEMTGWVMWYVACREVDKELADLIMSVRRSGSLVKDISTMAKSLGLNSTQSGSMICELVTLQGRGAVVGDADVDVHTRINKRAFLAQKAAVMDKVALRREIRNVLREEMAAVPKWQPVEDYWSKRWLYTRSGSHTRHIEDILYGERLDLPPQPTRREFAESIRDPVIAVGTPAVFAGLSWKLEHGKTRAIYGCDSRSYFTYDYLLGPVEAVWRNKNTLLNPGSRQQAELYEDLAGKGPYYYMLDFDDYNSQHELDAMKMVIEEACADAPSDVRDWAVSSWDNMSIRWISDRTGKLRTERMVGTLPSGHRATTFINTILNAAYCRVVLGDTYGELGMYHAGDDVIAWGTSDAVSEAIVKVEESPLRVNRSKQSAGSVSGEFLRIAFGRKAAYGYTARAIASAVSGNWVSEAEVAPRSYVDNFTRLAWTMSNRSGVRNLGALLVSSLTRRVPTLAAEAYTICTNRVSLGGSPIMTDLPTQWTKIELEGGTEKVQKTTVGVSSYATDDYLHKHIDMKLLKEAGVSPGSLRALMLKASYKPRGDRTTQSLTSRTILCPPTVVQGLTTAAFFRKREVTEFSATKILESLMAGVDWRVLVARIRGVDSSYITITGKSEWPVGGPRGITYSDCVGLRRALTRPTLVRTVYKIFA